ncbi:MAG: hypothetical protein ACOCYG_01260 [Spirochaetota bacterium]
MAFDRTLNVRTTEISVIADLPLHPLDEISVRLPSEGTFYVRDANGRRYGSLTGPDEAKVRVSGALGRQWLCFQPREGDLKELAFFDVDAETEIDDEGGVFKRLLYMLHFTAAEVQFNRTNLIRTGGRVYRQHVLTSRDTIHALKAMIYFETHMKDVVDLFSAHQRADGMIYDFAWKIEPGECFHYEWRMPEGYTRRTDDDYVVFARQLVENDLEHMFIRGLYTAWQATGDDYWMAGKLDAALAAMRFSRSSPYFFSEKFGLLKRAYTSDTWDFQSLYDTERAGGDIMLTDLDKTVFGVMHGDNTGMADSCRKLETMLRFIGRDAEAEDAAAYADHLHKGIDELAWNGEFYTHHVSEDPSFVRDFGVDESKQVSLSNAYNLNRGIDHDKAVAIIKTYQRIREEMPAESVGEWYHIFPPFERGWHIPKWDYTNGGLKTIVAGELAHGAFEHGFEPYGVDILKRIHDIGAAHGDRLFYGFTGGIVPRPDTQFAPVDLTPVANLDVRPHPRRGAVGWAEEPGIGLDGFAAGDLDIEGVPFRVLDAEGAAGGLALSTVSSHEGTREERHDSSHGEPVVGGTPRSRAELSIADHVRSIYLLHACDTKGPAVAGEVEFCYADGTSRRRPILADRDVLRWLQQRLPEPRTFFVNHGEYRNPIIAWQGRAAKYPTAVVTATGINNPETEKVVDRIVLHASPEGVRWNILGLTTADQPAFFPMKDHTAGAPANWGAGALTYALMEGLVGVVDRDRNYEAVTVSPRWFAAGIDKVRATAKYAEGRGYVSYSYRRTANVLELAIAGSGVDRHVRVLLPDGATPIELLVNGEHAAIETEAVEASTYLCLSLHGVGTAEVRIGLQQPNRREQ